jgi:hypothetical protein
LAKDRLKNVKLASEPRTKGETRRRISPKKAMAARGLLATME